MVDENGYYRITGRLKDMIIRGGENIYPREIEEYLYLHPKIKDVQVVGVPSRYYGEEVVAFVQLKPGKEMTEIEAKDFVGIAYQGIRFLPISFLLIIFQLLPVEKFKNLNFVSKRSSY